MCGLRRHIKERLKTEKLFKRGIYMNIGFLNLLTLIFVVGKLLGLFKFGWLIVFMPTIISAVLALIIILVALVASILGAID